jgi:hypothetical protein
MIYVKSFLAGVAALIIAALIVFVVFFGAPIMGLLRGLSGEAKRANSEQDHPSRAAGAFGVLVTNAARPLISPPCA